MTTNLILEESIETLDLPSDTVQALKSWGMNTIGDLTRHYAWDVLNATKSREITSHIEAKLRERKLHYRPI